MQTKASRIVFVVITAMLAMTGHAFQWQQWRGPTRDGIVPAANVPARWPEKPTLKWKQPAGEGYSSPVVDGGRIFVHSRQDPQEVVTAFDLESGKQLWRATYAAAFTKNQYATQMAKGPFSTPLVAGGRIYTLGVTAVLSAFDAATGALKWRKDFSKRSIRRSSSRARRCRRSSRTISSWFTSVTTAVARSMRSIRRPARRSGPCQATVPDIRRPSSSPQEADPDSSSP